MDRKRFLRPELHRSVQAPTTTDARFVLESEGCTELRLHTDDTSDVVTGFFKKEVEVSSEDHLGYLYGFSSMYFINWWRTLVAARFYILGVAALAIFQGLNGRYWGCWLLGALVFSPPLVMLWLGQTQLWLNRMYRARTWYRWEEVLHCIARLESSSRRTRIEIPPVELARMRAMALAGLGQIERAFTTFKVVEQAPEVPRWLYLTYLNAIYEVLGDTQRQLEVSREALVLQPNNSGLMIDLANVLARKKATTSEARDLLRQAEALAITEIAKPHVSLCLGNITYHEGNYAESVDHFRSAVAGFQSLLALPLVEGSHLEAKALLCRSEAANANQTEAKRLLKEVEGFLKAIHQEELLEECARLIERKA